MVLVTKNYFMRSKWGVVLFIFVSLICFDVMAQTPWDAIFMPKRELCAAVIYDEARFSNYWEGEKLIENKNIGIFRRQTTTAMLSYGITNFLDATVMLPYIKTSSSGGQLAGVQGFQDINVSLKGRFLSRKSKDFKIDLVGVVGLGTPVSNYLSDYMPYSIGLGCTEFSSRLTSEFSYKEKTYLRLSGAHIWRGATKIERAFYYDNGSVYSEYMNVPNAINIHSAFGLLFLDGRLRTELTYWGTWCTSGDDIRTWVRPQPTNKFEFQQMGIFMQYYFKKFERVSVVTYINQMIAGRNIGKFYNFTLGATYQFRV
jgi:hypothetical protein